MTNIKDQKQRDIIVNDLNKNIFVEAGAGSGKTRSLVERMVSMVKSGIDVSKICAITFTKAAAVEFYNRFENMLSEAINDNISDKEKRLCEKALLDIDLCFMGTIDAFCNMILSENPVEAGIPLNSTIVENEEYIFLIKEEYNEILKDIQDHGSQDDIDSLKDFLRFQTNPKEAFATCMNRLLNKRNYRIDVKDRKEIQKREKEFYDKYQDEIQKLVKGFTDDNGIYMTETSADNRAAKELILNNEWAILNDWSDRPSLIIRFLNKGLKNVNLVLNFSKQSRAFNDYFIATKKHYKSITEKVDEVLKEYKSIQYDYTLSFINRFINKVSNSLIKKGKLSFFDNLLLFRDLLKEDAKNGGALIQHITNRHEYYLVDEFQDTDPLQSEIIFYLTAAKINEDFTLCKPKPGRLFIVGDPKQSIYRFRNADVVSYGFVKDLFVKNKDTVLELTSNFRSHKEIIKYFNTQFKSTFNNLYDGLQAPFSSVDYVDSDKDAPILEGVYKYASSKDEDAPKVGNLILHLIEKGYKYGDIMVLTYTKSQLKKYREVFEKKAIPYEIEGQSAFNECEPFVNLRYLLGAIANPDNSYYIYKTLKMLFKVSDSHIYSVYEDKGPTLLRKVNDPLFDKLVDFYNNNINENVNVVVDRLIEEFDLLNISSINHLEYLYYAKELLKEKVSSGAVVTLKEAYKFLNDLTDKGIVERCLSLLKPVKDEKEKENRVLLANVHKVKGLERKVVVLTSSYKNRESDPTSEVEIHTSFSKQQNYIIKIGTKIKDSFVTFNYIETDDYSDEAQNEGRALLCEEDRIAYVAATRASDVLFISSNSINDDGIKKTPWGDLINDDSVKLLIKQDDDLFKEITPGDPKIVKASSLKTDVLAFDPSIMDKTYSIKTPSKLVNIDSDEQLPNKTFNSDAAQLGSIVHRLLELYVSNKFKDSIDLYLDVLNSEYVLDSERISLIKDVFNTMKNGGYKQDQGKVNDLISELKEAEEVFTELPFAYKDGLDIYNGIIDLLYKKNDEWFIVDYKTNYDPKELDKKYENQLEGYKEALSLQGIDAKTYIYHIDIK